MNSRSRWVGVVALVGAILLVSGRRESVVAQGQPDLKPGDFVQAGRFTINKTRIDYVERIPPAGGLVQVVVGQLPPLLLQLALEHLPVAFDLIPVHDTAPRDVFPRVIATLARECRKSCAQFRRGVSVPDDRSGTGAGIA